MKTLRAIKRAWGLCAPYHKTFIGILFILLIQQVIGALFPLAFGSVVNGVTNGDMKLFIYALAGWALLAIMRTAMAFIRELVEIKTIDFELSRHLSRVSMKKFFTISMGQHRLGHSLIKQNVMSKGQAAVAGTVYQGMYDLVPTALMILIPTIFLLTQVPVIGLLSIATLIGFTLYSIQYNLRFIPQLRKLDTMSNQIAKRVGEFVHNAEDVYVNAQERRVLRECDDSIASEGLVGRPLWIRYVSWFYTGQWLITLAQIVCIILDGYFTLTGRISTGMFVTVFMWIGASLGTMNNISNIQRNLAKNLAPTGKYFKFLDYEPDIVMPKSPVHLGEMKGRIEFRNVNFTYESRSNKNSDLNDDVENPEDEDESPRSDSDVTALSNVSFVLEEGKRYAFVGRSGAGKSTIVGIILRAYDPQSGQVLVDGVDVRMLDYMELRRNIGLVPQDVSLFDGTVRYNITFGVSDREGDVSDADLADVAKLSRVSEFKDKLEKGWDTLIGERGIKLSGGQRQRIGIARALIKKPHILIFDEATSSLDTENEARIRESIMEASAGKTTIIIAHRLATVRDADKIFVIDEGKLVGEGTHEELLRDSEYYQRLVKNQVIVG